MHKLKFQKVLTSLLTGTLKDYQLEKKLGDYERAVLLRRQLYENILDKDLSAIPYMNYDWAKGTPMRIPIATYFPNH